MDEYTARRLIYIKSLFLHGEEHSRSGNQIDVAITILNYDSSIEMLLYSILEFHKGRLPDEASIKALLKSCNAVLKNDNIELPSLELENLRRARNGVQHSGIIPCQEDVLRYESLVRETLGKALKRM